MWGEGLVKVLGQCHSDGSSGTVIWVFVGIPVSVCSFCTFIVGSEGTLTAVGLSTLS